MSNGSSSIPLLLGTAQFGSAYGITNRTGCPDDFELRAILRTARSNGIEWLDTARAYGDAEQRIGRALATSGDTWRIVTKIEAIPVDQDDAATHINTSLRESLVALGTPKLDTVLFHSAADCLRPEALAALQSYRQAGQIGAIGVSVYSPEEAFACLEQPSIEHIQIPYHLLDNRWTDSGFAEAARSRGNLVVHARSLFLQGLLLSQAAHWPQWVENREQLVAAIDRLAQPLQGGKIELCLRFHRSFKWISASVIGVNSCAELKQVLAAADPRPLQPAILEELAEIARHVPQRLLNPPAW